MKNFYFIKNQKGTENLICENFMYTKGNRANKTWGWRCSDRKCCGVGLTNENVYFETVKAHNHDPVDVKIENLKALLKIKEETDNSCKTLHL
jgi:hypothetical protein